MCQEVNNSEIVGGAVPKEFEAFVLQTFIQDASYNGKTLIGDLTGSAGTFGSVGVIRNEAGDVVAKAVVSAFGLEPDETVIDYGVNEWMNAWEKAYNQTQEA